MYGSGTGQKVLNEDLSLSKCTQDHASLNQVNCSMTERYSCKFARFYCRAIALCWIEQQEETSWFCLSLAAVYISLSAVWFQEAQFSFWAESVEFACLHGSAGSGTFDCQAQFALMITKWTLSFCHHLKTRVWHCRLGKMIRSLSTPLRECSHQNAHTPVLLFCCVCFLFLV